MFLGIDTSCYTTSIAVVDKQKKIIIDKRCVLDVAQGERGLQQSKAVWQHIQNLPKMISEVFTDINPAHIKAVAVSIKPRPSSDSYLPVFQPGVSHAQTIASTLEIPIYYTTHQEGHIVAGCTERFLGKESFLAIHLSGGTSELLLIKTQGNPFSLEEIILGKTLDLHGGQLVDRVGVALGLQFPCGPQLEKLAQQSTELSITIPSATKGLDFSLSGPESAAQRLIAQGADPIQVARAVEQCLVNTLHKIIIPAAEKTGVKDILLVGGVGANQYIRLKLTEKLSKRGINIYFAETKLSSDNAVGIAIIGNLLWNN